MNLMALLGGIARFLAEAIAAIREWKLISAGEARGRAASDAAHARVAVERGEAMRQIADRPPGRAEADKRLEEGSA